jgi:hypothetical protein
LRYPQNRGGIGLGEFPRFQHLIQRIGEAQLGLTGLIAILIVAQSGDFGSRKPGLQPLIHLGCTKVLNLQLKHLMARLLQYGFDGVLAIVKLIPVNNDLRVVRRGKDDPVQQMLAPGLSPCWVETKDEVVVLKYAIPKFSEVERRKISSHELHVDVIGRHSVKGVLDT